MFLFICFLFNFTIYNIRLFLTGELKREATDLKAFPIASNELCVSKTNQVLLFTYLFF